jgi:site-specific DNA recombinase
MRAGVYTRISSDPKGLRAGVERQRADCVAFCEQRGWEVHDVYEDNDVSAYSGKPRPAYRRLLEDVEAGRVQAVVAWHNDRLHRSPRELENFIDLVERTGVKVAIVTGGDYDLTTPDGRLAARVVGAVARKSSEDMSRRIKRKHLELAETGRPASWEGWGTRTEAERELVREAAGRVLAGQGLRTVVRDWNERGVPAPSAGARWSVVALRRVLLAPRIAGLREHGRDRTGRTLGRLTPATWEGAVSRETWEELRLVLLDPSRTTNGGDNARRYLLAGFVTCGDCGGPMRAQPRADGVRCYVCVGNRPGHQLRRLADPLEELVRDNVLRWLETPAVRRELERRYGESTEEDREAVLELAHVTRRLERLEDALIDGDISKESYRGRRATLERERDLLAERVLRSQRARVGLYPDPRGLWESTDLHQRRELVRLLVERVVVLPARRGFNRFDPSRVRIEMPLVTLLEAARSRGEEMTDEEREAGWRAHQAEVDPETERDWSAEDYTSTT